MNKFLEVVKKILASPYFNWGIVFLGLLVAIYFSSPVYIVPKEPEYYKFFLHIFEYAFISLILFRAFYSSKVKKAAIISAAIAICIGILDEIHQLGIPGRGFQFWDILLDIFGAVGIQLTGKFKRLFLKEIKK